MMGWFRQIIMLASSELLFIRVGLAHSLPLLLPYGPPADRSGIDDPHADHRLSIPVRAESHLFLEVQVSMAYRWLCGLGRENATSKRLVVF